MRLLRLVADGDFAVEFHPYLTVVTGLSADQHDALVTAFEEAAVGRTTRLTGLIEVHGVVLDLDDRALGLLDLQETEVDLTVTAYDLPGSATSGLRRKVRAAEQELEALEQPRRDRVAALEDAERRLAEMRDADGGPAVPAASTVTDGPRSDRGDRDHRAEVHARRAELQARRDQLSVLLDPGAGSALDTALADLAEAEREHAAAVREPVAAPADETSPTPAPETADEDAPDPAEVAEQIEELEHALALHRLFDPGPLREALDQVRLDRATGEMVPSTEALDLADRIDALDRRFQDLAETVKDPPPAPVVDDARARREEAETRLRELQQATPPEDPTGDAAELERAHAAVEAAREELDAFIGRGRAQRRLDEAVRAERAVLERLGLGSYTDYLTRGGAIEPTAEDATEIEQATEALAEAEAEVAELQGRLDAALAQAAIAEDRRRLRDRARELLDDPDIADEALGTALSNLRVPARDGDPVADLVEALTAAGLPVQGMELPADELEALAADWLAEHSHAEAEMVAALEARQASLTAGTVGPEPGETDGSDPVESDDPNRVGEDALPTAGIELPTENRSIEGGSVVDAVDAARIAVRDAKARVVDHETALARLSTVEDELAEVERDLASVDGTSDSEDDDEGEASSGPEPTADDAAGDEAGDDTGPEVAAALVEVERIRAELDDSQAAYDTAVEDLAVLRRMDADLEDAPPPVEEIEWYLLARLASQRNVSFAGSVPLLVDRALDGVADDDGLVHLLERLERMAGAVQIVHLSDDERIVAWASALPADRAAVVEPVAALDA